MNEKITLSGVPETMLQTLYARAKETCTRGAIRDEKAAALARLLPGFRLVEEHSLCEGMAAFVPVYRLLDRIPLVRNISNRIVVLERA